MYDACGDYDMNIKQPFDSKPLSLDFSGLQGKGFVKRSSKLVVIKAGVRATRGA